MPIEIENKLIGNLQDQSRAFEEVQGSHINDGVDFDSLEDANVEEVLESDLENQVGTNEDEKEFASDDT